MNQSICFLAAIILFTTSCKKEEIGSDNPNVSYRLLNQELKLGTNSGDAEMEVDIDGDGSLDFEIDMELDITGPYYENSVEVNYSQFGNKILSDSIHHNSNYTFFVVRKLSEGDLISAGNSIWHSYPYIGIEHEAPDKAKTFDGFAGKGDVLVGIRFLINGDYHYGWMKVNLSSNYRQFILKEAAWETRPNVEIKVGDV